jgi:predicted DNA-binding transcriptional regulator YafY
LSPQKLSTTKKVSEQKQNITEDIARMRSADSQGSSNPDDDELLRQIQLAIKYKAKMLIVLTAANGEQVEYLVEPVGVANGRLRAKDRKADIERTLPLSSVVSIAIQ